MSLLLVTCIFLFFSLINNFSFFFCQTFFIEFELLYFQERTVELQVSSLNYLILYISLYNMCELIVENIERESRSLKIFCYFHHIYHCLYKKNQKCFPHLCFFILKYFFFIF